MKKLIIALIFASLVLSGCKSADVNNDGNPVNRSLLIDHHLNIGLDLPIVPIPLPKIAIDFALHFRRLTPKQEVDLNLSKLGKFRDKVPAAPITSPTPFPAKKD